MREMSLRSTEIGGECGGLHALGDEGEGVEDVGELGFGQGVEVGDEAVQLGAQLGAGGGVRDAPDHFRFPIWPKRC